MHNDGRLGELHAAAKDLPPVEQWQPMRDAGTKCVCVHARRCVCAGPSVGER